MQLDQELLVNPFSPLELDFDFSSIENDKTPALYYCSSGLHGYDDIRQTLKG
jgi:hypothetical protein